MMAFEHAKETLQDFMPRRRHTIAGLGMENRSGDLSSMGTMMASDVSCSSFDDASSFDIVEGMSDSDFRGLEENDALGPFVHEEVKEAMLFPLSYKMMKRIWSPRPETIMEGKLFKKGRAQIHSLQPRRWQSRYFKLHSNGELSYYKNHHKKGSISLTGATVRLCAGTSFRTCIEPKTGKSNSTQWRFSIRTERQEIVLAARTKHQMQKWLTVIRALCKARSSSVHLIVVVEIEVNTMAIAELAISSPRTRAASEEGPVRRRASEISPYLPQSFEKCHHFNTFSPKECAAPEGFDSNRKRLEENINLLRPRAQSGVLHEVFTKFKDWHRQDGVLRVIRVNDVPPTVYQPKFTMKVQVKI